MNSWRTTAIAILKSLTVLVFVLYLTSCGGEKAVSQEPSGIQPEKAHLSKLISEVSPPITIQELRPALEVYQPQVVIVTPKSDEILQDNTVTVRFQVKDLPLFKDQQLDLGPHLQVILDNEPYLAVYDLNQPLVLPNVSPGTHTLRVFASYPWNESFKNEGAYAETTFHVFTKTDDNNPDPTKPLLTYNSPQGQYGAQPILLDFYLTNAPLHLVAQENPKDEITDWRIRCTINDESFVLDRWQAVYLKGFKPGKNWVKLEFLDEQGNPVKNVFNSTVKLVTYEPKGQNTLAKIVRGELSADQLRAIVDLKDTGKIPVTPTPTVEKPPETKLKEEKQPPVAPKQQEAPQTKSTQAKQQEKPPQTTAEPSPSLPPTLPKIIIKSPQPETTAEPSPSLPPTLPEIIIKSPQPETTDEPQPKVTPKSESTVLPEKVPPHQDSDAAPSLTSPLTQSAVTPKEAAPETKKVE